MFINSCYVQQIDQMNERDKAVVDIDTLSDELKLKQMAMEKMTFNRLKTNICKMGKNFQNK